VKNLSENLDRAILHKLFWPSCLIWYFGFSAMGFFTPLIDHHQFRQAQTAWGAWSMAEGVNPLRYQVPVLGPPWSAPFEFPVYQALTGWGSRFSGLDLIFVGRIVGMTFFLLSVFCFYEIFRMLCFSLRDRRLMTAFYLLSPFYIFWSRAILMESTALALAILSIYFFLRLKEKLSLWSFVGFAVTCSLAAVVKATTYFAFALFLSLWVAWLFLRSRQVTKFQIAAVTGLVLSVVAEVIWSRYSAAVRVEGILTEMWRHDNVMKFVTGEMALKFDGPTWARFFERGRLTVGHKLFFIPLFALPWMSARLKGLASAGIFFILVPFLLFTNVHVRHDYYAFAHGFGFIMLYCSLLIHLLDSKRWRNWGSGLVIGSFALLFSSYLTKQVPHYRRTVFHQTEIDYIKNNSQKDDVILISGIGWDPTIPFLAGRRAAMFQFPLQEMAGQVRSMLQLLKEQNYKTPMWVVCDTEKSDPVSAKLLPELLGREPTVVFETKECRVLGL
jgi:hypothetical protein